MFYDGVHLIVFTCSFMWTVEAQFGGLSIFTDSRGMSEDGNQNDFDAKDPCADANATCVPISSCPLLYDLLVVSCFNTDRYFHRFNSLICGRRDNENYVCCPSCQCQKQNMPKCGKSMIQGYENEGLGAHPWVARIGFTNLDTGNVGVACVGSIISSKVILTAAHCALTKHEGYQLSTVVVGEWDAGRSPDCNQYFCAPPTQAIKVERVIVHPGYEAKIFRHDIALLILVEDIKFTVTAAPVCLSAEYEIETGEMASLVGWRQLSGQRNVVNRQQVLEVPIVPLEKCQEIFEDSVPVQEGHLCAGGEEGKDGCSGFGGAPLLLRRNDGYEQVGLASFGSTNCGGKDVPSVYTKIPHYYKWIIDNSPS